MIGWTIAVAAVVVMLLIRYRRKFEDDLGEM